MKSGMEMMLSSLGIDPEKIKAELTGVLKTTTDAVMERVNSIEATQQRIEAKLDRLLGLVPCDDVIPVITNRLGFVGSMDSMPSGTEVANGRGFINGPSIDLTDRN